MKQENKYTLTITSIGDSRWSIICTIRNFWGKQKIVKGLESSNVSLNKTVYLDIIEEYNPSIVMNSENFFEKHSALAIQKFQVDETIERIVKGVKWDLKHLNPIFNSYKKSPSLFRKTLDLKHSIINRELKIIRKLKNERL